PLPPVSVRPGIGRNPPGSPAPGNTSGRYSSGLAWTSLPGSGRRCPLARVFALLASSLDFLQGTLEKIHFQRLIRQRPSQLFVLQTQRGFSSFLGLLAISTVGWFQLIAPLIQHPPVHTQLLRQRSDILAVPHPLDRHLTECDWISPYSLFCHLQLPP